MPVLDRYMVREFLPPFVIGVAAFTFVAVVDRMYQLADMVIAKGVPAGMVVWLLALMVPSLCTLTLPLALLMASMLACNRLVADLEVVALQASGVRPSRLFRPILVVALVVTAVVVGITLFINPWTHAAITRQLARILEARAVSGIEERTFSTRFPRFMTYVEEVIPVEPALRRLIIADERHPERLKIFVAREGQVLADRARGGLTLRLMDGAFRETTVEAGSSGLTTFRLCEIDIPPLESAEAAARPEQRPRDLPLVRLIRRESSRAPNGVARTGPPPAGWGPERVELHKRFALPIASLVFATAGFSLGMLSRRGRRSAPLVAALLVAVGYYVVFTSLGAIAQRGDARPVIIWVPNVVFGLLVSALFGVAVAGLPRPWSRCWSAAVEALRRLRALTVGWRPGTRGPRYSTFIIERYLVTEYGNRIVAGLGVAAALFLAVDLIQNLDDLLRADLPYTRITRYLAANLVKELYEAFPLVVLIATVFLFGALTRSRELDALKAAGISLHRVAAPILGVALLVSVCAALFQEAVLPGVKLRMAEFDRYRAPGARAPVRVAYAWYRTSDTHFLRLDVPREARVERRLGLIDVEIDQTFRSLRRLQARKVEWTWPESTARRLTDPLLATVASVFEPPAGLARAHPPADTMSVWQMWAYVNRLRESSRAPTRLVTQLYSHLAFPLVHVIFALVAIPLTISQHGRRLVGAGIGLVIAVGYWVVHAIALSFANAELLPPLLGAWTANLIFGGVGVVLTLRMRT